MTLEARSVAFPATLRSLLEASSATGSRKKLARAIGVNEATVSHYLHGRAKPSFDALIGIARFFNVSTDYLIFGERPVVQADDPSTSMKAEIRLAIAEASDLSGRHLDMFSRITRVLQNKIDDAARELAESTEYSAQTGFISQSELISMEAFARRVRVMTRYFASDLNDDEPGPFFDVVVNNLMRGCVYEYLMYGEMEILKPQVDRLRTLIEEFGVPTEYIQQNLLFRWIRQELVCALCVLDLDLKQAEKHEPILLERHRQHISADGVWSYMSAQQSDAQGGFTIEPIYADSAIRQFDRDWRSARRM